MLQHCQMIDPRAFVTLARADDPRLGETARVLTDAAQLSPGDLVVLGVPDDRGIAVNGGRSGAAEGPAAVRAAFYRMPGAWLLWDAGDVVPGANNIETHERLASVVSALITAGALPVIIGGSHDNTYGGIAGLARANVRPGVMNWDAHLDVRPVTADAAGNVNSGCGFRRLLDDEKFASTNFWEIGIMPHARSAAHLQWLQQQGAHVWEWPALQHDLLAMTAQLCRSAATADGLAVSFDLDLLCAADAPGVSAPSPLGLRAADAVSVMRIIAQQPTLRYLDLMECSPPHDVGGQTARLTALLLYTVCQERLERACELQKLP